MPRMLAPHLVVLASSRALPREGRRIAMSSAMMATTTSSSMRVNACDLRFMDVLLLTPLLKYGRGYEGTAASKTRTEARSAGERCRKYYALVCGVIKERK